MPRDNEPDLNVLDYVTRELQCHSPSATEIDGGDVARMIYRGERPDLVTKYRVPPDVAGMIIDEVERRRRESI